MTREVSIIHAVAIQGDSMWEAAQLVPVLVNRVDQEDAARNRLKRTEPTTVGSGTRIGCQLACLIRARQLAQPRRRTKSLIAFPNRLAAEGSSGLGRWFFPLSCAIYESCLYSSKVPRAILSMSIVSRPTRLVRKVLFRRPVQLEGILPAPSIMPMIEPTVAPLQSVSNPG